MAVTVDGSNGYSVVVFGQAQSVRLKNSPNTVYLIVMETTGTNPRLRAWKSTDTHLMDSASFSNTANLTLNSADTASSICIDNNDDILICWWRNLGPISSGGLYWVKYTTSTDTFGTPALAYVSIVSSTPASFFQTGCCIHPNGVDWAVGFSLNTTVRSSTTPTVQYGYYTNATGLWSTRLTVATTVAGGTIMIDKPNSLPILSMRSASATGPTATGNLIVKQGNALKATSFSTKTFTSALTGSTPNHLPLTQDNEGRIWVFGHQVSTGNLIGYYHLDGDSWSTWSSVVTAYSSTITSYTAAARGYQTGVRDMYLASVDSSNVFRVHTNHNTDYSDTFNQPVFPTVSSRKYARIGWGSYGHDAGHAVLDCVFTGSSDRLYYQRIDLNQMPPMF